MINGFGRQCHNPFALEQDVKKLLLKVKIQSFFIVVIGCWVCTEFTAWCFSWSPKLPLLFFSLPSSFRVIFWYAGLVFSISALIALLRERQVNRLSTGLCLLTFLFSIPLYFPWAIFHWLWKWRFSAVFYSIWHWNFFILMMTLCISYSWRAYFEHKIKGSQRKSTFGSAHWATQEDIKQSGLLDNADKLNVTVGGWTDTHNVLHHLQSKEDSHVFAYAPTRSGKGVGLVIPTLLSYRGSVIVSDIKMENWQKTAGWRQSIGQRVMLFNPTSLDESTIKYNPLFAIRRGIFEVRDAQNIAEMIINPDGKRRQDHWDRSAADLLVTLILHVLYAEKNKSLSGVRQLLCGPVMNEVQLFEYLKNSIHDPEGEFSWRHPQDGSSTATHPHVASGAMSMLGKSENERSGVISTLKAFLQLYQDPIIEKNTSESSFRIEDLLDSDKPVSLYLGIPPSDIQRVIPLVRLVLQQILSRLTEILNDQKLNLLLMMDEFPQFGRLAFFEKSLAYCAGYGIRAYLICQDLTQLYEAYGGHQSIISNCNIRVAYTPNNFETAKHLSNLIGSTTMTVCNSSYSGKRFGMFLQNVHRSDYDIKRALLTPDELMRLPSQTAIIMKTGLAPILGEKLVYYTNNTLLSRTEIAYLSQDYLYSEGEWNVNRKSIHIANVSNTDDFSNVDVLI